MRREINNQEWHSRAPLSQGIRDTLGFSLIQLRYLVYALLDMFDLQSTCRNPTIQETARVFEKIYSLAGLVRQDETSEAIFNTEKAQELKKKQDVALCSPLKKFAISTPSPQSLHPRPLSGEPDPPPLL